MKLNGIQTLFLLQKKVPISISHVQYLPYLLLIQSRIKIDTFQQHRVYKFTT
ncbi:MAG: hypothetical protein Sylvanvirus5_12 [Sylvanvirus sp.]|uniref:Uncharacterized protein n=1 Tax=Sylvanvirus sp. TaxID=2487774 RepID=A0A3G5AJ75_9VIRU|nr:MAG: hypothetical protein Sylvanvirus5_12 [Sylvanvirus sp.]